MPIKYRDFLRTGGISNAGRTPQFFIRFYLSRWRWKHSFLERFEGAIVPSRLMHRVQKRCLAKNNSTSIFRTSCRGAISKLKIIAADQWKIYIKDRIKVGIRPKSVRVASKVWNAASHGTKLLANMFGGPARGSLSQNHCMPWLTAFAWLQTVQAILDLVWRKRNNRPCSY